MSGAAGSSSSSSISASTAAAPLTMPKTESLHSVIPLKVTHPRLTRRISVSDAVGSGIFRRRLHTVLYYKSAGARDVDSGWVVAGWTKESLGRALSEQPLLAGRLRRAEDGDEKEFEIVSNDSGVRILEAAWSSMTLSRFLELKDREALEADQLVFWKDIDEENLQFCPLFYVQVTNFECGGYTVGISCSLLLADPLSVASILKRWTTIHNALLSENGKSKLPLFYLMNLRRLGETPSIPEMIGSNTTRPGAAKIFNIAKNMNSNDNICSAAAASVCFEEAERRRLGTKTASKYWLFLKEQSGDVNVEACWKEEIEIVAPISVRELNWDDLGVSRVSFFQGNSPVHVSFWINNGSAIDDGLVMISPSSCDDDHQGCSGMNVIVVTATDQEEEKMI